MRPDQVPDKVRYVSTDNSSRQDRLQGPSRGRGRLNGERFMRLAAATVHHTWVLILADSSQVQIKCYS